MKRYIALTALLLLSLTACVHSPTQQGSTNGEDLLKELKVVYESMDGQTLEARIGDAFEIVLAENAPVDHWQVMAVTGNSLSDVAVARCLDGKTVVFMFKAIADGSADIYLVYVHNGAAQRLFSVDVEVGHAPNVAPQPPIHMAQRHVVEFGNPPATMTVHRGDEIVVTSKFKGQIGLYDPAYVLRAKTLDGQPGDVLASDMHALQRLDSETFQIARFTTQRAGDAEIVIRNVIGTSSKGTIKVHVN